MSCICVDLCINICDLDKPESYEHYVCMHRRCTPCLKAYIKEHLSEGKYMINCPIPKCNGLISYYDIQRIDSSLALDYQSMISNMANQRPPIEQWDGCQSLTDKPSRCPQCQTYVYRWDGCEVIYCICGETYCSLCEQPYLKCLCPVSIS